MVPQVPDVVLHEEPQCDVPVTTGGTARMREAVGWSRGDHVGEMSVVRAPERDDVAKRDVGISLAAHPDILVVPVERLCRAILAEDEAPVVIARGINKMAEDVARAPLAGRRRPGGARFVDALKQLQSRVDGSMQISGDCSRRRRHAPF